MTEDQLREIQLIVEEFKKRIKEKANDMPVTWTGHELHWYLADLMESMGYGRPKRGVDTGNFVRRYNYYKRELEERHLI